MLARLEVAYLAILRVVLLVAATLALLVTVVATVSALPALGNLVGLGPASTTRGGTLRDFIETHRVSEVDASDFDTESPSESAPSALPTQIAEASKNFARYDAKNGGEQVTQSDWDDAFRQVLADGVPGSLHEGYGADVLRLSEQLMRSKGTPLSNDRLLELLEYHRTTFLANAAADAATNAGEVTASMGKLVLAGAAFLIFVLVLFNFIFVKIERNLRPFSSPVEE